MVGLYKTIGAQVIEKIVKSEVDVIVKRLMERFDKEIMEYEDPEDPARPSVCRDEFEQFLRETIESYIKITKDGIEIGVGDNDKLGFSERLDEDTTDCVKIMGTILQGIVGEYVLVTSEMAGGPVGRFGRAFIMPAAQYELEAVTRGWDPGRQIWSFSNFKGVPDFFEGLNLKEMMDNVVKKIIEEINQR